MHTAVLRVAHYVDWHCAGGQRLRSLDGSSSCLDERSHAGTQPASHCTSAICQQHPLDSLNINLVHWTHSTGRPAAAAG